MDAREMAREMQNPNTLRQFNNSLTARIQSMVSRISRDTVQEYTEALCPPHLVVGTHDIPCRVTCTDHFRTLCNWYHSMRVGESGVQAKLHVFASGVEGVACLRHLEDQLHLVEPIRDLLKEHFGRGGMSNALADIIDRDDRPHVVFLLVEGERPGRAVCLYQAVFNTETDGSNMWWIQNFAHRATLGESPQPSVLDIARNAYMLEAMYGWFYIHSPNSRMFVTVPTGSQDRSFFLNDLVHFFLPDATFDPASFRIADGRDFNMDRDIDWKGAPATHYYCQGNTSLGAPRVSTSSHRSTQEGLVHVAHRAISEALRAMDGERASGAPSSQRSQVPPPTEQQRSGEAGQRPTFFAKLT